MKRATSNKLLVQNILLISAIGLSAPAFGQDESRLLNEVFGLSSIGNGGIHRNVNQVASPVRRAQGAAHAAAALRTLAERHSWNQLTDSDRLEDLVPDHQMEDRARRMIRHATTGLDPDFARTAIYGPEESWFDHPTSLNRPAQLHTARAHQQSFRQAMQLFFRDRDPNLGIGLHEVLSTDTMDRVILAASRMGVEDEGDWQHLTTMRGISNNMDGLELATARLAREAIDRTSEEVTTILQEMGRRFPPLEGVWDEGKTMSKRIEMAQTRVRNVGRFLDTHSRGAVGIANRVVDETTAHPNIFRRVLNALFPERHLGEQRADIEKITKRVSNSHTLKTFGFLGTAGTVTGLILEGNKSRKNARTPRIRSTVGKGAIQ